MDLSISFDDAELAVISELLGERLLPLGPTELDGLAVKHRSERLADATRSLLRRGVFVEKAAGHTEVVVVVARLVEVLARPLVTAHIFHGNASPGWAKYPTRVAAVQQAAVIQERAQTANRLTPFATEELLRRIAVLAKLDPRVPPAGTEITIDKRQLARALAATSPTQVYGEVYAGVADRDRELADQLVAAILANRGAVSLRTKPIGGRSYGLQFSWVWGPEGAWELPVAATPIEGGSADDLRPGTTVTLTPISGEQLVDVLANAGRDT